LIENGKRTRFIYHNGELLYEKGEENKQSKEETSYQLGAGIEALQRNQKTYYYHQDEQLNTALITNRNGEIKNQYQYDAFGNDLEAIEELSNRIRYTGQQYDQQTEQYYLRARYYNPIVGRFIQEDVYQGDGLNLYIYCRNNPVVYYDPSGYNNSSSTNGNICAGEGKFGNNTDAEINKKVNDLINKIPNEYKKIYQCNQFATQLKIQLEEQGYVQKKDFQIIRIDSPFGIYSTKQDEIIGLGYHYGIKVRNNVYDNLTPNGMNFNNWLLDLGVGIQPESSISWHEADEIRNF
jgi:RHS repeat-associated protein